ncbi:MAG: hypothetical protein AAGJ09_06905 [Pseudomonadota bacterium]
MTEHLQHKPQKLSESIAITEWTARAKASQIGTLTATNTAKLVPGMKLLTPWV